MDAQERKWLQDVAAAVARIEGRIDEFESSNIRDHRGLHARIGELKEDSQHDLEHLEERIDADLSEVKAEMNAVVKRPAALAGGGAAAFVAVVVEAGRRLLFGE